TGATGPATTTGGATRTGRTRTTARGTWTSPCRPAHSSCRSGSTGSRAPSLRPWRHGPTDASTVDRPVRHRRHPRGGDAPGVVALGPCRAHSILHPVPGRLYLDQPGRAARTGEPPVPADGAPLCTAGGDPLVAGRALAGGTGRGRWHGDAGAGSARRVGAGGIRDVPGHRWRGLLVPAPLRGDRVLRMQLPGATAVPAPGARIRPDEQRVTHPDAGDLRGDAHFG